jgi:hypothetical protein
MWIQTVYLYIKAESQISLAAYEKSIKKLCCKKIRISGPEQTLEPPEKDALFLITRLKSCR